MSKSLGNFITIREALKDWPGEVLRFNMLKAHYRQPIDWTLASLNESQRELDKFYPRRQAIRGLGRRPWRRNFCSRSKTISTRPRRSPCCAGFIAKRRAAMWRSPGRALPLPAISSGFSSPILPIGTRRPSCSTRAMWKASSRRGSKRAGRRDWAESDRIRDELIGMGIALKDNKDGTTSWEVKR